MDGRERPPLATIIPADVLSTSLKKVFTLTPIIWKFDEMWVSQLLFGILEYMNIPYTQRPYSFQSQHSKSSKFVGNLIGLMLFIFADSANAQVLVVVDDSFGIPSNVLSGEPFIVEEPSVLKNDTLDLGDLEDFGINGAGYIYSIQIRKGIRPLNSNSVT
jgi:hypothetical protein